MLVALDDSEPSRKMLEVRGLRGWVGCVGRGLQRGSCQGILLLEGQRAGVRRQAPSCRLALLPAPHLSHDPPLPHPTLAALPSTSPPPALPVGGVQRSGPARRAAPSLRSSAHPLPGAAAAGGAGLWLGGTFGDATGRGEAQHVRPSCCASLACVPAHEHRSSPASLAGECIHRRPPAPARCGGLAVAAACRAAGG